MPPKKPILKKSKLPIFKTTELRKIYSKLGFQPLNDSSRHRHIILVNNKGVRIPLIKGNKDIRPELLQKIIKEISQKTGISKEEIIKIFLKYK